MAAPVTAGVTLAVSVVLALHNSATWRLWAPVIGMGVGSAVGGLVFGIYDTARVLEAACRDVARSRPQLRPDLLVPAAGVRADDAHWRTRYDWR